MDAMVTPGFVPSDTLLAGLARAPAARRTRLCASDRGGTGVPDPQHPASTPSSSSPWRLSKITRAAGPARKIRFRSASTNVGDKNDPTSASHEGPMAPSTRRSMSLAEAVMRSGPFGRRQISIVPSEVAPARAYWRAGSASLPVAMVGVTIGERLLFFLGEFLTWNSFSKIQAMFAVSLVFVFIGAYLFRLADPKGTDATSPVWRAIRGVVNPFEDDFEMISTRAISVLLSFVGILFFGILVGIITEGLENGVANLGNSTKVAVAGHTLFCGWNSHVPQMIKDLSDPQTRVGPGKAKIVILEPSVDQQDMIEKIRDTVDPDDLARVKLYVRNGRPVRKEDLEKVGASRAAKIVLVGHEGLSRADASRDVLSRAIALKMSVPDFKGEIVSEAHTERDEIFVKSIVGSTTARGVHTIAADVLLGRLVAQAIHQPGLFNIVSTMMSTDPANSFDFKTVSEVAPQFVGQNFTTLRNFGLEDATVCGHLDPRTGLPSLQSRNDGLILKPETQLVVFGKPGKTKSLPNHDSSRGTLIQAPKGQFNYEDVSNAKRKLARKGSQSILLCGWKADMQDMLVELDQTVGGGSVVTLLADESCGCDSFDNIRTKELRNLRVKFLKGSPDHYDDLEQAFKQSKCTEAVMLSLKPLDSSDDVQADSRVLSALVYMDSIARASKSKVMLNATFQHERTAALASKQLRVENILMSKVIEAKLSSQAVRHGRINHVWREILSQKGREVYLRPATNYVKPYGKASFAETSKFASLELDEIAIGYRTSKGEVILNPSSRIGIEERIWAPSDKLIVLAK